MDRGRLGLVAVGGAVGVSVRWSLLEVGEPSSLAALLGANLVGCFVLGVAVAREGPAGTARHRLLHDGLAVGFCGGLTTFSTLAVEVAQMGRDGRATVAGGYLAASVALGLAALRLGASAGGRRPALDEPLEGER